MSTENAIVVYSNRMRQGCNIIINEKYRYIALKQIALKTNKYKGMVMLECGHGITLNTKTYYEAYYGTESTLSVIKLLFLNGEDTFVADFSSNMEFFTLKEERSPWLDINCISVSGRRVYIEGDFVFELR